MRRALGLIGSVGPITNPDDHDGDARVNDLTNNSIIADSIFPKFAEFCSPKRLAYGARVFQ